METQWVKLTADTAQQASQTIAQFLNGASGFDQQLWSLRDGKWTSGDAYQGRVSQALVRVLPDSEGEAHQVVDCWLTIGWGNHVRVPCFREGFELVMDWRIAEDALEFRAYKGSELQFMRRITRRERISA